MSFDQRTQFRNLLTLAAFFLLAKFNCSSADAATMYLGDAEDENIYAVDIASQSAVLVGSSGIDLQFGGLGFAQDGTLYGWFNGELYTVNTTNGLWSFIGSDTPPDAAETFDINPVTNEAIVTIAEFPQETLYTVALGTGNLSFKTGLSSNSMSSASAFGPDGTLYYIDLPGENILKTDVNSGIVDLVGAIGFNVPGLVTNLSYNPEDNMLYAVKRGELYQFDPNNGSGVNLGAITGVPLPTRITMGTIRVIIPEPTLDGDFDNDVDVDGADFLAWQRGESPDPLSTTDLNDWQMNFGDVGNATMSSFAGLPEPATLTLAGLCLVALTARHNR